MMLFFRPKSEMIAYKNNINNYDLYSHFLGFQSYE